MISARKFGLAFLSLVCFLTYGQQIEDIEYFFDADPGYGNATKITGFTFGSSVTIDSHSISTSSLSKGFHVLYIRAYATGLTSTNWNDGVLTETFSGWGVPEQRLVYVDTDAANSQVVDAYEYYFDNDPGYGSGTIVDGGGSLVFPHSSQIATTSLSQGFHVLWVRPRLSGGTWGIPEGRLVFLDLSGTVSPISAIEYFFDEDPGYGSGTVVTGITQSLDVTVNQIISTTTLSSGFHNLYMRPQLSGGGWGIPESRLVFVDQSGTMDSVSAIEYFFDDDPGYGSGTAVTGITQSLDVSVGQIVSTSTLSSGFHNLYMRPRLSGGGWGIPESRLVFVDQSGTMDSISAIEYFFDDDPGYGSGTAVTGITQSLDVTVNQIVSTSTLSTGFHNLNVRPRLSGGSWGMPESRLVFVDQEGAANQVSAVEYFFDSDPGYGSGTPIPLTVGVQAQIDSVIASSTLSEGFHNLHIRVKTPGGVWGIPENRLLFVDANQGVHQISDLEYFFDNDPGYGLGNSIAIEAGDSVLIKIMVAASQLSEGLHHLFVRPQDNAGNWGLPEVAPFHQFSPSRELDSVSLIAFYNETAGPSWTTRTNWKGSSSISNWFGVTVTNGRVSALKLPDNNIIGPVPKPLGYLSELLELDLSENILKDTVPATFQDLEKLTTLKLHDNQLDEMTDVSTITTLATVSLDSNYFDFDDLEPLIGISNLTYQNQKPFNDVPSNTLLKIGEPFTFQRTIEGQNNDYQWYLNDETVEFGDYEDLTITNFMSSDTGTYVLQVSNTVVPNLTITTNPARLYISDFEEDSLAMVSLYQALNGDSWTNKSNWLTGRLQNWSGVTVSANRVTSVSLPQNNLSGEVPADLWYADQISTLNLSQNQIEDTIPASVVKISALQTLNLSQNKIASIPNFSTNESISTLNVESNKLQFGDLEYNIGVLNYTYSPQDSISIRMDTVVDTGIDFKYLLPVTGANNSYQWFYKGNALSGATDDELNIPNIQLTNEGQYRLRITNPQLPNLTLHSAAIDVLISSLTRDSKALLAIYEATGGPNWSPAVNWTTADITNWNNITLGTNRVIGVNLSNHNLTGSLPGDLRDITSLQTADFSGNELTSIAKLSIMPNLTSLNISNNRLGFAEIIANQGIANYTFSPQKEVTSDVEYKIPVGTSQALTASVSGTGNRYQWRFKDQNISGSTATSHTIDIISYTTMGAYRVQVTNPQVPNLTLSSGEFNVLATADLAGLLLSNSGVALPEGNVVLYKIVEGPYDSIASDRPSSAARYEFEDVVLGDYLVKAIPDDPTSFVTYYGNTIIWTDAEEIGLRESTNASYDIRIAGTLVDPGQEELVLGVVEIEVPDEERISARRKVVRAGCAMRRYKGTGRGNQDEFDLEFYVETDDEGRFSFTDLPNGLYRLNIDYPGVGMDENSFVEIEITGEMVLELLAVVTENGILVEQTNALGIHRPIVGEVSMYPNPTSETATFKYQLKRPVGDVTFKVRTLEGKLITQSTAPNSVGFNVIPLDVRTFEKGVYLLILEGEKEEFNILQRLIVE